MAALTNDTWASDSAFIPVTNSPQTVILKIPFFMELVRFLISNALFNVTEQASCPLLLYTLLYCMLVWFFFISVCYFNHENGEISKIKGRKSKGQFLRV